MRSTLVSLIMLTGVVGMYTNGCQSISERNQSDEFDLESADVKQEQDQSEELAEDQQVEQQVEQQMQLEHNSQIQEQKSIGRKLAAQGTEPRAYRQARMTPKAYHPKEPTAWFTRRLLMVYPQPSATKINECRERVESSAADAPNFRALDEVALALESTVESNPLLYHWCFYQLMADLDIKLDSDSSLMEDKSLIFLSRMRSLWALARALDSVKSSNVYLTYLRTRYTEINQSVFGRTVESMDRDSFTLPTTGAGKAATKYEEK